MKEKGLHEILIEVYGQDYVDLVNNDKKKNDQYIFESKMNCIKNIMRSRSEMGSPPDANMFDFLYDKDLYELQRLQVEWIDMLFYYNQQNVK